MKSPLRSFACGLLAVAATAAQAQTGPPVLNPPITVPAPAAPIPDETYLLGRTYRVETTQGTIFTGQLVSMSLTTLEFDAAELGHVRFERSQIRRADLQGPAAPGVASRSSVASKSGYYDIGNGNRLFFAPTARGLRKNEATLQDIDVYFIGLNYGHHR